MKAPCPRADVALCHHLVDTWYLQVVNDRRSNKICLLLRIDTIVFYNEVVEVARKVNTQVRIEEG